MKNIEKIDKEMVKSQGIKCWVIIGNKYFEKGVDGNKYVLAISDKVGNQLKSEFEKIKQNEIQKKRNQIINNLFGCFMVIVIS